MQVADEEKLSGNTTYPALVGNVLAQFRKEKGIGQAEFGALVGIGQSTWSRIEKGESALTIEQLAKAAYHLELAPHELLAVVDGAQKDLLGQGIGTLMDRIGVNNMALLGSIPVVGPTLTAVLSGVSTYRQYAEIYRKEKEKTEQENPDQENPEPEPPPESESGPKPVF
jgi:transcriptional regulator with XRE-family HTH domain